MSRQLPVLIVKNIYDKWVSTNVYAMHRPLGQKKQAIYFMLRPKYFASGLNFPVNRHYTPLHKWTEPDLQLSKDKIAT